MGYIIIVLRKRPNGEISPKKILLPWFYEKYQICQSFPPSESYILFLMIWFLIVKLDVRNGLQIFTWKKDIMSWAWNYHNQIGISKCINTNFKKCRLNFQYMHPKINKNAMKYGWKILEHNFIEKASKRSIV